MNDRSKNTLFDAGLVGVLVGWGMVTYRIGHLVIGSPVAFRPPLWSALAPAGLGAALVVIEVVRRFFRRRADGNDAGPEPWWLMGLPVGVVVSQLALWPGVSGTATDVAVRIGVYLVASAILAYALQRSARFLRGDFPDEPTEPSGRRGASQVSWMARFLAAGSIVFQLLGAELAVDSLAESSAYAAPDTAAPPPGVGWGLLLGMVVGFAVCGLATLSAIVIKRHTTAMVESADTDWTWYIQFIVGSIALVVGWRLVKGPDPLDGASAAIGLPLRTAAAVGAGVYVLAVIRWLFELFAGRGEGTGVTSTH